MLCNNCFKYGHQFQNCNLPIQSYGIIAFRYSSNGEIEYLMIRRKDSFSYIDLIRGKYSQINLEQLQDIIDNITCEEKERILNHNYEELRNMLWCNQVTPSNYKSEDAISKKKFEYLISNNILQKMIKESKTYHTEQEWEFPKGRRNLYEKEIECAIREFEEETGYTRQYLNIIHNICPYDEIFIGSNCKSYKHRYFLAYIPNTLNILYKFQKTEVSKIEWKTYIECQKSIRENNIEKKRVLTNVHGLMQECFVGKIY